MELIAKRLRRRKKLRTRQTPRIRRENRRPRKSEEMILLKMLHNRGVHIPELTAVTFVEDDDDVFCIDLVFLVLLDKRREFLNRRDDDPRIAILELPLKNRRRRIAVRRPLFKTIVFLHRLIIEILAIHDKKHLVDIRQERSRPRRLKRSERLPRTRRVPDVPATRDRAVLLVIVRNLDAI